MVKSNCDSTVVDQHKSLPFLHRHYLLLKAHYFFCYSSFGAIGPILNITLRSRALSDVEISYINLVIPFLVFFTNPLLAYFADHTRRFRLTFNIILCLATSCFIIIFFLPSIKSFNIQGEMHQTDPMEYSLTFCADKGFATKCASRSQCGCTYQASCTSLIMGNNYLNKSIPVETLHFNFTMDSTYVEKKNKNVSIHNNANSICPINYRVPINQTIAKHTKDQSRDSFGNSDDVLSWNKNSKLATCNIKCSTDHLCHGSRYPQQIIFVLLYSFLILIGLNLSANATTIGTSIGFVVLHRSNLFGRQRLWGTIGVGITAFVASRLYAHFKTEYLYIYMSIASTILTILITSFLRIRSDKWNQSKSDNDDMSIIQKLNDLPLNQNKEKTKNHLSKIRALLPLIKKIDVVVFLSTAFLWGTSFGALDPYLLLYIDEISPCESHSIAGYMSLITAAIEVVALLVAHQLLKRLGTKISSILIFIAFGIRFSGYYLIRRPYLLLSMETMHFFNFGILYVLIAQEALQIAPPALSGTLQGIVYGITFGLGRAIGLLISLFIYTRMKKRRLFLIYAIINFVSVVIYAVYCLLSKRKSSSLTASDINSNQISKGIFTEFEEKSNGEALLSSSSSSTKTKNKIEM